MRRHAFTSRHGIGDRLGHTAFTLELGRMRVVMRGGDDAGNQIRDGTADHTRLTQRGEHLVDVMQERRAGADHQHSGTLQRATMRIQQVGRAMQRDRGLAGSRTALHHHRLVEVRTDDTVLLALDGGHDIGHFAGAFGVKRRKQSTLAGQCAIGGRLADLIGMHVEHLILDADHFPETQRDMPAHDDVAMIRRRRLIERACRVGAPVGENRLMILIGQADTPNVAMRAMHVVEPAENQTILHRTKLGETVLVHGGEGIAFGALRGRTVRSCGPDRVETRPSLRPQRVQTIICAADGLLLLTQLGGITRHCCPFIKNLRHSNVPQGFYVRRSAAANRDGLTTPELYGADAQSQIWGEIDNILRHFCFFVGKNGEQWGRVGKVSRIGGPSVGKKEVR